MSRSQNTKSHGRGKHSNHPNTVVHSSIQFDKLFCENKPTAAKSAGTVGKWGITSFTSIRSSSFTVGHSKETSRFSSLGKKRQQPPANDNGLQVKRPVLNNNVKKDASPVLQPRKFFKSRNNAMEDANQKSYRSSFASETKKAKHSKPVDENKKQKTIISEENKPKVTPVVHEKRVKLPKRLTAPKLASSTTTTTTMMTTTPDEDDPAVVSESLSNFRPSSNPTSPKERDKPPIVLRICKGKSQLLNDKATANSDLIEEDDNMSDIVDPIATATTTTAPVATTDVVDNRTYSAPNPVDVLPVAAAEPSPTITTRSLRRRSPEKSKPQPVVEPTPPIVETPAAELAVPPVKVSRRAVEKAKSLSPEPSAKTRSGGHRQNRDKSKSPSPEAPAITTRSLRRRPAQTAPAEPAPIASLPPPTHTSPKRALRSSRNAAAPVASKIVITNLNSDHPSVYINDPASGQVPSLQSPGRKEAKECRSYTNRHRHAKTETSAAKTESADLKKVEQVLADLSSPTRETDSVCADFEGKTTEQPKSADTSLDSDRAELLQMLEDDEDDAENAGANTPSETKSDKTAATTETIPEKVEPIVPTVVASESELKIKIKISDLRKSSTEEEKEAKPKDETVEETAREPEETTADETAKLTSDSADSGIELLDSQSTKVESESTKEEVEDRLVGEPATNSDSEATVTNGKRTISQKKGSFFKHRSSTTDGNKKRLALYKHKWTDEKDANQTADEEKNGASSLTKAKVLDTILNSDMEDLPLTKFIRQPSEKKFEFDEEPGPVMGLKCAKKNKEFYTVVRNVKKAHQIQESGEFQEFNDDVEYILDALKVDNPIGTRCLSAITLATKCMEPAFRMHVRAHGTVTKFFRTLHDATKDQSLGLCTATVMFVLSQDRLNMDLDRDSLELMLNLLESDASHTKALEDCGLSDVQSTKMKDKVRQICADIQAQGQAKNLNLDNITVGHLSMETLLSLTSKRAGEWFKEELRELGGLEHIIKTVVECCKHVDDTANAWSATSLEKIRKVDRCLRVLENVTAQNEQNNDYLLEFQNGILIDTLVRMFKVCDYEIPLYPTYSIDDKESTGAVLRECLIANLKVLINITHDYQTKCHGSQIIGSRPGVIESSLHVLLQVPQYVPKEEKFDLMLLTLIMLINLVEHCDTNRKAIIEAKAPSDEESIFETKAKEPAVKALISMFYNFEELARNEEKKTDAILEGESAPEKPPTNAPQKAHEDFIEETISQLVQKAGQNMEHTLIAAYVAMTIGYLIIDNEEHEKYVRNHLPEKNFKFMISILQKFYSFMTLTASGGTVSNHDMKSIQMVIQKFTESDKRFGFDSQNTSNTTDGCTTVERQNKSPETRSASDVFAPS